jgi:hypothetical protein
MKLKGNPKLALVALVAVFLVAFALSLHMLGSTGGGTTILQYSLPNSGQHVVFVHYVSSGSNVTNTNYVTHPCVNHN